jgi:hypothetical protein
MRGSRMDRFDTFSERARHVLTLAQDEAQRLDHHYIGTEHLLLGLVREGEGVAARVLANMNVELAKVRTAVEFIVGRSNRPMPAQVGLTPRAKRVIELSIDESKRLGQDYIGTEHLLLGLVREGEGIAAGVLKSLGVNLDKVRHEVIRALANGQGEGATGTSQLRRASPVWSAGAGEVELIEPGDVVRVIGVGEAADDGLDRLELLAIEVRTGAIIVTWSVRSLDPQRHPSRPIVGVSDNWGTPYGADTLDTSRVGNLLLGRTIVVPTPALEAKLLLVQFVRPPLGEPDEGTAASWRRFEIKLRD